MKKKLLQSINIILLITIFTTLFSQTTFAKQDIKSVEKYQLKDLEFTNEINTANVFDKTAIKSLQSLIQLENTIVNKTNKNDCAKYIKKLKNTHKLSNDEIRIINKVYKKSFKDLVSEYDSILNDEYIENRVLKSDKIFKIKHELSIFLKSYLLSNQISEEENILIYYILFNFYQSDQIVINNGLKILDYKINSYEKKFKTKFLKLKYKNALKNYEMAEKMLNKNLAIPASQQYLISYRHILNGFKSIKYSLDSEIYKSDLDSDNDSLEDGKELLHSMNPFNVDSDNDGLNDYIEFNLYPNLSPTKYDTNDDGISDLDEDIDLDGLSNGNEILLNTKLNEKDTDKDGLTDGFEVNEFNTLPTDVDTDKDGLSDYDEFELGTNPNNPDSDNDGIIDSLEIFEQTFLKDMTNIDKTNQIKSIEVTLSTNENINSTMRIYSTKDLNIKTSKLVGLIGSPVEINTKSIFDTAIIKFNYDENMLNDVNEKDLGIIWFNEDEGKFELLDSSVDEENNSISVETTHFSEYMIVNLSEWFDLWNTSLDYTRNSDSSDPGSVQYYDIVFAIDSSGSMTSNDPLGLRKEAAKQFVDVFYSGDQGAVIDFDRFAYILVHLTQDKDAIKVAIDKIDSSGGTNINNAVNLAIDELESSYSNENNEKLIILLTDGNGIYNNSTTDRAIEKNIKIFTVGLGSGVNPYLLEKIANDTGGKYYYAVVSEDLGEIFSRIEDETIGDNSIDTTDSDGDGLYDTLEINGMKTPYGIIYTNPFITDSDGDGLSDYEEMFGDFTYVIDNYSMFYPNSLPNFYDSDHDGINDKNDSLPMIKDLKNALIFQSNKAKGEDDKGNIASDMTYNDYTKKELTNINFLFWDQVLFVNSTDLFDTFEYMATSLFATGDMEDVIIDMISHFKNGNGSEYTNSTLTKEAKEHQSTQNYIELVKEIVIRELKLNNGELSSIVLDTNNKKESAIYNNIQEEAKYPDYSTKGDLFGGLTIAVHDTWGNSVEVQNYSIEDGNFKGVLKFSIYDHFGLDEGDLVWNIVPLAGFRSWFTLQHYDKYNGDYKPFVTNMDIEIPFEGVLND